ncbi:acyltransferase family protein [Microbacterium azadirachtae]|uniref:acyltransferase family protein n=1 Tax=Microbacterium azadirachtae TaxID=582680 RepID=UPI0005ED3946|nr:acyltransferase [Microbacterium azadirachtae]SDL33354.1 Peptidoglycan/LPS O-acetylase OafA/YrhL, contains acyltransferase and SGNH-hydrolase domains [Microbacterium azadirachtae]SEF63571.1 Peptidoglycan/LPS O-acetylase OafA/YrhL, contains acyltransferase and SGNH-hydrolase domains [Microbacterium azadirachtae]SEF64439.1 Peptidoglycan/LPS O-acetylase OafA/YrhL, contains acyltransferase and SGNH-hydrolase domains [Microbacterium azadirachtae]
MSRNGNRIGSLDGLRGLAAGIVLIHHASLIAEPWLDPAGWAVLTQSPLKLLIAGSEAVMVFFVLSGLVVALPALRPGFSWARYFPARLFRLYVPVIAALGAAALLVKVIPRDASTMPDDSWMQDAQATSVSAGDVLSQMTLLRADYPIDNVLWSLRWELFFSLLLPLYVWVALRVRRFAVPVGVLTVVLMFAGRASGNSALAYLPVFLLGTLIAVRFDDLRGLAAGPRARRALPWVAALAGTMLIASWLARPLTAGTIAADVLWALAGAGAALLVILAVIWPRAERALGTRPMQWLGRISFSLYLVHAPILATLCYLLGAERWWLACLIGVPLSLVAAAAFHALVERQSQVLARRAGAIGEALAERASVRRVGAARKVALARAQ